MNYEGSDERVRRQAFLALVEMQDQGCSVRDSRSQIADQFGIDLDALRWIETEGIAKQWPPL